jgi:dipeptidyl-peptidase-4
MKYFFLLILGLAVNISVFTQGKNLTIADVEIGSYRELAPLTLQNIQWRGSTTNFTFQDSHNLYQQTAAASGTTTLLSTDDLNKMLKQNGSDTLLNMPSVTWVADNEFYFTLNGSWFFIDVIKKTITNVFKLPKNSANHSLFYATRKIAYTIDNNLYVMGADNRQIQITRDTNPDIVNGETVSRNEFGINGGIFWSHRGNFIAYYRKDNSKVEDYPLVDVTARQAQLENIKYPMAGMASEHISLGVFDLASAKTIFIDKEDTTSEKYLTNISWSPDEKHIYIQVLNRAQDYMMLNKYLVNEGSLVKTLFEERNNRYVEPLNKIVFLEKNKNWFF